MRNNSENSLTEHVRTYIYRQNEIFVPEIHEKQHVKIRMPPKLS